jgi:glycosyltransferase involved in cell wall biosynthesis
MNTALVHDYLLVMRGAERSFAAMADCWPEADIYTTLYDPHGTQYKFSTHNVTASYLQHLGLRQSNFRRALPLFPRAVESLPLQDRDLVISSSSAFAHGVKLHPDAVHVCYCYTPFRYAWHERARALDETAQPLRPVVNRVLDRIREWDLRAAARVSRYVAISRLSQKRIADAYGREAAIVHPPVDVDRFSTDEADDYALVVTEIVRHKRVDVALEAARRAGQRVKVVGTGPDLPALQQQFGDGVEFLGRVSDAELCRLHARARVFLMANVEEFGIAAVEAQAAGRPVVAAAAGGALETVLPGETGVLVPEDNVDAMAEALLYTDFDRFSSDVIRQNAERFSVDAFKARLRAEVDAEVGVVRPVDELVPAAA